MDFLCIGQKSNENYFEYNYITYLHNKAPVYVRKSGTFKTDSYVLKSDLGEKINGVSNSWTKSITINVDEFGFYMISAVQEGNVKWFGFVRLNGTSEPFLATISGNTSDIVITRSPDNKQMTVASANGENFYIIIIG